nr:ABC transporter substrate-binding protein [uncultured Rhodoferax sp.]
MWSKKFQSFLVALASMVLLAACSDTDIAAQRAARAAKATGDIVVGVSWPFSTAKGRLWEGVAMAQEEINAAGGVLGRKLVLVKEDDQLSVTKGTVIAHKFAANLDMVAVIGTLNSYIAIPTAPVYEFAGMVMLTQGSSVVRLTNQGYKKVFRMIPSNRNVGEMLADYAKSKKYKHVLVYYVKNEYGLDLANAFEQRATSIGVEVTDRVSYLAGAGDYKLAMQHWKDFYNFDAIFLAGSLPEGAQIIRAAREIGIKVPIFAADGLDSPDLMTLGGDAVEGVEVTSFFHPNTPTPAVRAFNDKFVQRYKKLPDTSAALGYDAVTLLAHAMTKAKTTVPADIAAELHKLKGWSGVTGEHGFDGAGNVMDKPVVMQVVKNGQFEFSTIGH